MTIEHPPVSASGETDHLAASVLRSLGRSLRNKFSLEGGSAAVLGLITFGLWPVWKMRRQFNDYVTIERQQFWHLAEWLRVRRGGEEALALHDSLKRLRTSGWIGFGIVAFTAFFIGTAIAYMDGGVSVRNLIGLTYKHRGDWFTHMRPVYATWVVALSLAYVLHAAEVGRYFARVTQFVERFNRVAVREGVDPIPTPRLKSGLSGDWIVGAVLLSWLGGALWSIPMALGGALQRQYINVTGTRLRAELLDRARKLIQQQRPAVEVPRYVIHGRRCDNRRCRAVLHAGAKFCSRCGASTGVISSEVA